MKEFSGRKWWEQFPHCSACLKIEMEAKLEEETLGNSHKNESTLSVRESPDTLTQCNMLTTRVASYDSSTSRSTGGVLHLHK